MVTDIALGILLAIFILVLIGTVFQYLKQILKFVFFLLLGVLLFISIYPIYTKNTELIETAFILLIFLSPAFIALYRNYYAGLFLGKLVKKVRLAFNNQ